MMHLLGPEYTTNANRKRKSKQPTIDKRYADEFIQFNRTRKSVGLKPFTLDEYVEYRQGKRNVKITNTASGLVAETHRRETVKYESGSGIGQTKGKSVTAESERLRISGQYTVGQAYNKGGLVVLSKQDAKDPSTGKRR